MIPRYRQLVLFFIFCITLSTQAKPFSGYQSRRAVAHLEKSSFQALKAISKHLEDAMAQQLQHEAGRSIFYYYQNQILSMDRIKPNVSGLEADTIVSLIHSVLFRWKEFREDPVATQMFLSWLRALKFGNETQNDSYYSRANVEKNYSGIAKLNARKIARSFRADLFRSMTSKENLQALRDQMSERDLKETLAHAGEWQWTDSEKTDAYGQNIYGETEIDVELRFKNYTMYSPKLANKRELQVLTPIILSHLSNMHGITILRHHIANDFLKLKIKVRGNLDIISALQIEFVDHNKLGQRRNDSDTQADTFISQASYKRISFKKYSRTQRSNEYRQELKRARLSYDYQSILLERAKKNNCEEELKQ